MRVFRHDAERDEFIQKSDIGLFQTKFNCPRIGRDSLLKIRHIHFAARLRGSVKRISHVFCRQRRAIGKLHVVANRDAPRQTVFTQGIIGRQIIDDIHLRIAAQQRALKQRAAVASPAQRRIVAFGAFAANR